MHLLNYSKAYGANRVKFGSVPFPRIGCKDDIESVSFARQHSEIRRSIWLFDSVFCFSVLIVKVGW